MSNYFKNVNTLEELRKQYKELLKVYHPDNGRNVSDMQEINAEYDRLFKALKDNHEKAADNKENNAKTDFNNMKYDFSEDQKLRETLNKIIGFNGITIEVCGSWIWVFDSYNYRKELKEMNFKFAGKKKAWYWHSEAFRKKGRKILSMEDIRSYYGSTEVETDGTKRLKQAFA